MVGTFRYTDGGDYSAGSSSTIETQFGGQYSYTPVTFGFFYIGSAADLGGTGATLKYEDGSFFDDTLYDSFGNPLDTLSAGFLFDFSDGAEQSMFYGGILGDVLIGGGVRDDFFGKGGADSLSGSDGDDRLFGGDGIDSLTGGEGSDILSGDAGADVLRGGEGTDRAFYLDSPTAITVNLTTWTFSGGDAQGDSAPDQDIEDVDGSRHNDDITGNDQDNFLDGRTGDDILRGLGGNDTLDATTGSDILEGGEGNDRLIATLALGDLRGGTGSDTYVVEGGDDTVTELTGEGNDTVISLNGNYTLGTSLERLYLFGSATTGTGNELDNFLFGNSSSNTLTGLDGRDRLDGREGADAMIGGEGNDTYTVDSLSDVVTELTGEGRDLLQVRVDGYVLADSVSIEDVRLGGTPVSVTGNDLDNAIDGNSLGNTLRGEEGDDRLAGKGGDDVLIGGLGSDSLVGGAGADTFRFESLSEGVDFVSAFQSGADRIALSATMFGVDAPSPGALDPALFRANGTGRAEDADDRVIYNAGNGAL